MKHSLLLKLSFLICLLFSSFALNAQIIEQSAKNTLSETTVAYTYKLKDGIINNSVKDDAAQAVDQENKGITFFIDSFLKIKGVSRATFDKATQTFTIIATPEAKLNLTYTKNTDHE